MKCFIGKRRMKTDYICIPAPIVLTRFLNIITAETEFVFIISQYGYIK